MYSAKFRIDLDNFGIHLISYGYNFFRTAYEFIGKVGNMYQCILMHPYIHKSAKPGHISNNTLQHHTFFYILEFHHFFAEFKYLKIFAWIFPRMQQFSKYIFNGRKSKFFRYEFLWI